MNLYRATIHDTLARTKPVVTIWAEEKGALEEGFYDFSYGDGSRTHYSGYTMMCPGRVLRLGLSGGDLTTTTTVTLTVNRMARGSVTKEARVLVGQTRPQGGAVFQAAVKTFSPPLELAAGDVINFRSGKTATRAISTIVSALVELDL